MSSAVADEQTLMPISDTRREVSEQPQVVARVLDEQRDAVREVAATLTERCVNKVIVLGSGDSWFAGMAVRLAFERYAGAPLEPLQAYEYAVYDHPQVDEHTAVVVISSSGRPTTTWDALDRALATSPRRSLGRQAPAYVIGISDKRYPGNPFISKPHAALVPGAVKRGWPTQTTTATIALLIDLAIQWGSRNDHLTAEQADGSAAILRDLPVKMERVLAESDEPAQQLAQRLRNRHVYTLVGSGPSLGVAHVGSALLAEGPQEAGVVLPVEEFHHSLRVATLGKDDPLILIAPTGAAETRNIDTARSVSNWGARLIALVDENDKAIRPLADTAFVLPALPEPMSPLLTLLPLHILSIHLAEQKVAAGYQRPVTVP